MIITLTVNPAIDKTVLVDNFAADKVNRISSMREDAGGKGINVSKMVAVLGKETKALGFIGGENGAKLLGMLEHMEIPYQFVHTQGETRVNTKILDPVTGTCTDLNESGQNITEEELDALKALIQEEVQKSQFFVIAGGVQKEVPISFYKELIESIDQSKCKVMLDASGVLLQEGIKAKPWLIKPNIHELEEILKKELPSIEDVIRECQNILSQGISYVAVSMGSKGMLLVGNEGAYHAKAPKVQAKSTVGAGDSTVAALAVGFYDKKSLEEILKQAVAAGTAAVTTEGTNTPPRSLIEQFEKEITIQKY